MNEDRSHLVEAALNSLERMWGGAGSVGILDALVGSGLSDMTVSQACVLLFLRPSPQRMGRLAARLGTSLPSTTSIVSRLEQRGYVERVRDETDRRGVWCRLTQAGQRQIDSLYDRQREATAAEFGRLTLQELGTVAHAFDLLARAAMPAGESETPGHPRASATPKLERDGGVA